MFGDNLTTKRSRYSNIWKLHHPYSPPSESSWGTLYPRLTSSKKKLEFWNEYLVLWYLWYSVHTVQTLYTSCKQYCCCFSYSINKIVLSRWRVLNRSHCYFRFYLLTSCYYCLTTVFFGFGSGKSPIKKYFHKQHFFQNNYIFITTKSYVFIFYFYFFYFLSLPGPNWFLFIPKKLFWKIT